MLGHPVKDQKPIWIGYSVFHSGLIAKVGRVEFLVYLTMVSYVWRVSDLKKYGEAARYYLKGKLVTNVSQAKIGELLGLSRQSVNEMVKRLKDLGWLKSFVGRNQQTWFQLGERGKTDAGQFSGESFYFEKSLTEMIDQGEELAADVDRDRLERSLQGENLHLMGSSE